MKKGVSMRQYEYDITTHESDAFRDLSIFCSEQGVCEIEKVPEEQSVRFVKILNARGMEGWELFQVVRGKNGIMTFWKRETVE
jgi:hypothetical protein